MLTYSRTAASGPEFVEQRNAEVPTRKRNQGRVLLLGIAFLVLGVWLLTRMGLYKAGSDLGYYLGLAGGILMLLLFVYPLRKRVRLLQSWGATKYWFAVHMILGIAGPLLILAHSTFHVASVNAAVAFYSMLLVAGSGIVGRFIYAKIHRGLSGRKLDLHQLQIRAGFDSQEMNSKLYFAPSVERRLRIFRGYALLEYTSFVYDAWRFMALSAIRHWVSLQCERELRDLLGAQAKAKRWDRAKYRRRMHIARTLVANYLTSAQQVAQFTTYERLFSLWHVLHVPLVYLLILSSIAHVVAVHMY
jgi:hypothetical protein